MPPIPIDGFYLAEEQQEAQQRAAAFRKVSWLEWLFSTLHACFVRAPEMPGSGIESQLVTVPAAGWSRVAGPCVYFQLNTLSDTSVGFLYLKTNSRNTPSGSGADTSGAFLLRPGQGAKGIMADVWVYWPAACSARFAWSNAGAIVPAPQENFAATVTPSTITAMTGATSLVAANVLRTGLIIHNLDTSGDTLTLTDAAGTTGPVLAVDEKLYVSAKDGASAQFFGLDTNALTCNVGILEITKTFEG